MRLGIDFGTTCIVVAAVDRGNYPLVRFDAPDGEAAEWFPPLIAVRGGRRIYGWEAWRAQNDTEFVVIRSIKRFLEDCGPETVVHLASKAISMLSLLVELAAALDTALRSSLGSPPTEVYEAMIGVPANANSNQRFLTAEAFRQAGFEVLGLLNEPSAASIEFGHNARQPRADIRGRILIYDLGGGTFDASLVETDLESHQVITTEGIPTLGGDDFDDILAEMVLEAAGFNQSDHDSLPPGDLFRLHEECRAKKEALQPGARRIVIDLEAVLPGCRSVTIAVAAFYERCQPLVDQTMQAVERILAADRDPVDVLYVTGGASALPLVADAVRAAFGGRVRRSACARSATAVGLAIQADTRAGYRLHEQFTRSFGVWRESDAGSNVVFDALFLKGTRCRQWESLR